MQHYPVFLNTRAARIVLSGGADAAIAKLRLLLKTEADLAVFAPEAAPEILAWAEAGALTLHRRALRLDDLAGAALVYAADEDAAQDSATAALAERAKVLLNIVDNLEASDFITPAIVDRDPVTIAIGTEGAAPVLARQIKADLEARLPAALGLLARIGKAFRPAAESLPVGRARRAFWSDYYTKTGPASLSAGETATKAALKALLAQHRAQAPSEGHVIFAGAGPGDPELLTLKARRALHEADVVIYDRLVSPAILELARREALMLSAGKEGFGASMTQADINALIVAQAGAGAQVVRLKGGDPAVFARLDEEIEACEAHNIAFSIIPGITAASASAAALGQSLTKRGRNTEARLVTGHDMQGYADHDWKSLARPGEVAAIYMGKRAARYIQGRLLMHGAAPNTPVSLVENASLPNQRILATTLAELPAALEAAALSGPALTLLGLAPRNTAAAAPALAQEIAL
ncbi:siroheme synthase CysG [uncultured Lentibacter sp.]|uniref:siroheme synthase CysG n=1 Tax=uncultured Lentibacter sp. TaxID=1659309 RepID=UPI0026338FC0|nr:siroheme synthase CysG [uncultured Lentibacter sp.]